MKEIISKELLQEILESKSKITRSELEENELLFYLVPENGVEFGRTINIYELMFMAKEWAFNQKLSIITFKTLGYNNWMTEVDSDSPIMKGFGMDNGQNKLEYQAVFQACQYILDKELK